MSKTPDITNLKHPFWSASTGSSLKLTLKDSDRSLLITVHTTTQPYVYKLINPGTKGLYLNQKELLKHIKTEWWDQHGDRTIVEFKEQKEVIDPCYFESCPPTPSPRSIRRSSLKILLGSPIKDMSPEISTPDCQSVSQSPSPRSLEDGEKELNSSPSLLLQKASIYLQEGVKDKASTFAGSFPGTPTNSFNSELSPKKTEKLSPKKTEE